MKLQIKGSQGINFEVEIDPSASVLNLKEQISVKKGHEVPTIRLIYGGKILADNSPISTYGITEGHVIHMVISGPKSKPSGTTPQSPPQQPQQAPKPTPQPGPAADPLPAFTQPPPQANPFAGMGMPGMGGQGMGFPGMNGMPDLNQMAQMMQTPMFQNVMQQISENPEMLRSMMDANPMFANNPMMRESMEQMLANPEMLRRSMQMFQGAGGAGGQSPFDLNSMMQNPDVQRMMNDPDAMNEAMNMMGGMGSGAGAGAGANPFGALFGLGNQGAAPPAQPPSSTTANDKATFYKITGLTETAELNSQLDNPKAARAMRSLIESCKSLRKEGVQVFPTVDELTPRETQPAPPAQTASNEDRFASQLQQMNEMGLMDNQKNIRALLQSNGNVNVAIEKIFSGQIN